MAEVESQFSHHVRNLTSKLLRHAARNHLVCFILEALARQYPSKAHTSPLVLRASGHEAAGCNLCRHEVPIRDTRLQAGLIRLPLHARFPRDGLTGNRAWMKQHLLTHS